MLPIERCEQCSGWREMFRFRCKCILLFLNRSYCGVETAANSKRVRGRSKGQGRGEDALLGANEGQSLHTVDTKPDW